MAFCINCGVKLVDGAKFCHACGTQVGGQSAPGTQTRSQEYVGKILKCSNCGAVISESTVICPDCGMRITGRTVVSSIQSFKDQLMQIELQRKKNRMIDTCMGIANPADTQKLTLIVNYQSSPLRESLTAQ